jgi:hypothetical protein
MADFRVSGPGVAPHNNGITALTWDDVDQKPSVSPAERRDGPDTLGIEGHRRPSGMAGPPTEVHGSGDQMA